MQSWTRSCVLIGAVAAAACAAHHDVAPASARHPSPALAAEAPIQSPAEITARATPSIVTVRAGDSLGTGFLVRNDGWVATNFHVVRGATQVNVVLSNHREFPVVEIMNANRLHDLVILRIDARNLPVLRLANSDRVRPGDTVIAIGHPFGLEDTVSNGLISAVRDIHAGLRVLQISAPIAPGSSGGPLFNDRGEVIGVATAIMATGQNLNFGLPSNYVSELVETPRPIPMALFSAAMLAIQQQSSESKARERKLPQYPLSALSGCADPDKVLVFTALRDAIEVGAPLYNDGKLEACYHLYEGAAADLEQHLHASCAGPKHALAEARKRAAKLTDPSARAWVLRDSFDALLELLERSSE